MKPKTIGCTCQIKLMDEEYTPPLIVRRCLLCSAAPELLVALEGMLEWARRAKLKERNPGLEILNACTAIRKAEGGD